jgi:beta-fructofuranosidase
MKDKYTSMVAGLCVALTLGTAAMADEKEAGKSAFTAEDRATLGPHFPRYHFVVPDSKAGPFDPNGNLFWKGRHHVFYIFTVPDERFPKGTAAPFGHASSTDLVHWTFHPWALEPEPNSPDGGGRCWSGDGFVWDGKPAIAYWGDRGQTCLATSDDDLLEHWTKHPANPVIPAQPVAGQPQLGDHAPYVWKEDNTWYCIRGGFIPDEGDTVFLFKSPDCIHWEYLHPLYQPDRRWTEPYDDMACPEFFPLGGKHVVIGLSHSRGCHYYIGRWENERFIPESHGFMNWPGGRFGAPESHLDDRGRRILFAWAIQGGDSELIGVMGLPRVLELSEDGKELLIRPVEELATLRERCVEKQAVALTAGNKVTLEDVRGKYLEIEAEIDPGEAESIEIQVRCSPEDDEKTAIIYTPGRGTLAIDVSKSSLKRPVDLYRRFAHHSRQRLGDLENEEVLVQEAPLKLSAGEPLRLRVFLDGCMLEVFANGRQTLCQQIWPTRDDSLDIRFLAREGDARIDTLKAWEMRPSCPVYQRVMGND